MVFYVSPILIKKIPLKRYCVNGKFDYIFDRLFLNFLEIFLKTSLCYSVWLLSCIPSQILTLMVDEKDTLSLAKPGNQQLAMANPHC